jgi:hypothetical protein
VHIGDCGRFWLWAFAGGLVTFSVIASASIGLLVFPLALVALWLASLTEPVWPEALGTLAGAAASCFLIAYLQREPGGFDSVPWLVAGIVLTVIGVGGYALLRPRAARVA